MLHILSSARLSSIRETAIGARALCIHRRTGEKHSLRHRTARGTLQHRICGANCYQVAKWGANRLESLERKSCDRANSV
jgi:hypothetical protein